MPTNREGTRSEIRAWATAEKIKRDLGRGGCRVAVVSTSMAPLARRGDEFIFIPLTPANRVRVGDVLWAVTGDRAVTHRLLARRRGAYILKGDGAPRVDPPVSSAYALGVARALVRGGRALPLDNARGRVAGVILAALSAAEDVLSRLGLPARVTRKIFYLMAWPPARVLVS